MTTIKLSPDEATISFSLTELILINNALNEVCNGLDIDEFSTRMGVEREDAAKLLKEIHTLIVRIEQR